MHWAHEAEATLVADEAVEPALALVVEEATGATELALAAEETTTAAEDLTADDEVTAEDLTAAAELTTEEAVDVLAGAELVVVGVLVLHPQPKPQKQKVLLSRCVSVSAAWMGAAEANPATPR